MTVLLKRWIREREGGFRTQLLKAVWMAGKTKEVVVGLDWKTEKALHRHRLLLTSKGFRKVAQCMSDSSLGPGK